LLIGCAENIFRFVVTDKGFISFAAEKAGGTDVHPDAAKVMKPCSELNLREAESRGEELLYLYYWALIRMHRKCFGRSGFAVAGFVR
jgi:hypothetical protein